MKKTEKKSILRNDTIPFHKKLRTKLISSFLVPVLCIILLGGISYKLASAAIIANYENSASQTMEMTNQYLTLAIDTVRSNYKSYLSDDEITKYFKGLLDSTTGKTLVLTSSKEVSRDVNTNNLICDFYFISDDLYPITSASPKGDALYSAYIATPEGAMGSENRASYFLFGNQSDADEALGTASKDGVFSQSSFYEKAAASQESGMEYVTHDGASIAALLGYLLSGHINRNIYYILKQLKKISSGDLTIHLRSRAKDEFRLLAEGVNSMTDNMKGLITNVTSTSDSLNAAASQVSSSETFLATSEDIRNAVSEIDSGISQLDENSADCLTQMDHLSDRIGSVTQDANQSTALTQSTGTLINTGIASMKELTASAQETNLLSLNASIEASRVRLPRP